MPEQSMVRKAVIAGLKRAFKQQCQTREEVADCVVDALEIVLDMEDAPPVPVVAEQTYAAPVAEVAPPAPTQPKERSAAIVVPGSAEFRKTLESPETMRVLPPKPPKPEKKVQVWEDVQELAQEVIRVMPETLNVSAMGRDKKFPICRHITLMPSNDTFSGVKVSYTPPNYGLDISVSYTFWSWMPASLPAAEAIDTIERAAFTQYAPKAAEVRNSKPAIDGPITLDMSAPHENESIDLSSLRKSG